MCVSKVPENCHLYCIDRKEAQSLVLWLELTSWRDISFQVSLILNLLFNVIVSSLMVFFFKSSALAMLSTLEQEKDPEGFVKMGTRKQEILEFKFFPSLSFPL